MTLIVGIRCVDGVVMGADSAMTFGNASHYATIMQTYRQKLSILCGRDTSAIVGGSGFVGHSQRFEKTVKHLLNNVPDIDLLNADAVDIGRNISKLSRGDFAETLTTDAELRQYSFTALMAIYCKFGDDIRAQLLEFSATHLQPEVKSGDNFYVAIGSGQPIADTLLGLMRRVYWSNEQPDIQNGIFVTAMVLKLACEMAPGGIKPPIQIAILHNNVEGKPIVRELSDEQLQETQGAVEDALKHYGEYPESQLESVDIELPKLTN